MILNRQVVLKAIVTPKLKESLIAEVNEAIARVNETVRHVDWFEVEEIRGTVVNGEVGQFQVTMKVGFLVED